MAGVSDFIAMATQKLGVSSGAAQAGAGGLLDLVRTQAGPDVFARIAEELPGAARIAAPPAATPSGGGGGIGGMFGGLAQKAGAVLGGTGGSSLGVLGMLQKAGISPDKAAGFATMFVDFLKSKLSPELVATVLSKVGDLKKLAGG